MKPLTLLRLALAGTRTDVLRVVLTAVSALLATLAILAALTVLAIRDAGDRVDGSDSWSEQYASPLLREPGLRGGTALALVLLTIPILALAGQCGRLGAPARDRRLAGFRLAGATPGQAIADRGRRDRRRRAARRRSPGSAPTSPAGELLRPAGRQRSARPADRRAARHPRPSSRPSSASRCSRRPRPRCSCAA